MKFTYPVYVPSIDRHINFRELPNKFYIVILKFLANEDNTNLEKYLNKIIDNLNDDIKSCDLNKIDKFCILISLRITCIGPDVTLEMTCAETDQKYKGSIDLYNILKMVSQLHTTKERVCNVCKGIKAYLSTPTSLHYGKISSPISTIVDVIHRLEIGDKTYNLSTLTIDEKNKILGTLPGKNFKTILKYADNTQKNFKDLVVFKDKSPHIENSNVTEYKIGLYDNSMYEMIKLCYNSHIANYYTTIFTLCDTMNFTADYVENITPAESSLFIQQKRVEIENKKQQQQQQTGPTVGTSPSHGNF